MIASNRTSTCKIKNQIVWKGINDVRLDGVNAQQTARYADNHKGRFLESLNFTNKKF
jgi:hypothetical protein